MGATWTSLENAYTTCLYRLGAHTTVIDNVPGLTGWSGGGFTGYADYTYDFTYTDAGPKK